jgi:ubiquitin carboxyl-terminal hydrolase 7
LKASASQAIKYLTDFQLKDAFVNNKNQVRKLFYQKLNIIITELDERRTFKCLFLSSNMKFEKEVSLLPMKKALVRDLLDECRQLFMHNTEQNPTIDKQASPTKDFKLNSDSKLRLVEIIGSKINRIIKEEVCIDTLENQPVNRTCRIEPIDEDELKSDPSDILIPVTHFTKEIYATFGTPFYIKVKNVRISLYAAQLINALMSSSFLKQEPFKNIKKRIQTKLDVGDKEFSTVSVPCCCVIYTYKYPLYGRVVDFEPKDNWIHVILIFQFDPRSQTILYQVLSIEICFKINN